MKVRLEGVALLALCAFALHRLYFLIRVLPHHEATPIELAWGLAAVLTGVAGAAMLTVGPQLFRTDTWPPRDR